MRTKRKEKVIKITIYLVYTREFANFYQIYIYIYMFVLGHKNFKK